MQSGHLRRGSFSPVIHTRRSNPSRKRFNLQQARHASNRNNNLKPFTDNAQELLSYLKSNARTLADHLHTRQADLEKRFANLSQEISRVSGYATIEQLKQAVAAQEKSLNDARHQATIAKDAYTSAVEARSASQRETNDLLSRKNSWSGHDVSRFTELVQQDHINEQAEKEAKLELNRAEEAVESGLSALMRSILNRYHEEQVWSDKIRSLSTYGSLAITGANVLVFLLAVVLVEPWRRRRLVDKLEIRMAEREGALLQQNEAGLERMIERVEALAASASASSKREEDAAARLPVEPTPTLVEVEDDTADEAPAPVVMAPEVGLLEPFDYRSVDAWRQKMAVVQERIDWPSGTAGFLAGLTIAGLAGVLGR